MPMPMYLQEGPPGLEWPRTSGTFLVSFARISSLSKAFEHVIGFWLLKLVWLQSPRTPVLGNIPSGVQYFYVFSNGWFLFPNSNNIMA
jgi:hypothetical protein